jgi:hypothetical protein
MSISVIYHGSARNLAQMERRLKARRRMARGRARWHRRAIAAREQALLEMKRSHKSGQSRKRYRIVVCGSQRHGQLALLKDCRPRIAPQGNDWASIFCITASFDIPKPFLV